MRFLKSSGASSPTEFFFKQVSNWFAHISPDGKGMVFISFMKDEVVPGMHPPYKHVYIRYLPITGGTPKVLAYFYGGQGSINTPSWSPG